MSWIAIAGASLAVLAPKGKSLHRFAGRVYLPAMVITGLSGAVLGLIAWDRLIITGFAGVLAVYLTVTGWQAAHRHFDHRDTVTRLAALAITANTLALAGLGGWALTRVGGQALGYAAEDYFFLATLSALGGGFDVARLLRRSETDRQRLSRHLWRMLLGFFMAAGSLFTGPGAVIFPETVRQSGLLALPELAILLTLLIWLSRLRFGKPAVLGGRKAQMP